MLTGIDHIVVMVPDLELAVRDYRDLGFAVVLGGRHARGTHNALIGLDDGAYIELIAFYEPNPRHRWWAASQTGGGLVDFCMGTDDLEADVDALRRAGVHMSDPLRGERLRPDSYEVRWVSSVPPTEYVGVVPFLIKDETPRDERLPKERRQHNKIVGIKDLAVALPDTSRVNAWYEEILERGAIQTTAHRDLNKTGIRITVGPHTLEYVAPRVSSSQLADWLRRRGASPYVVTFRTSSGAEGQLDESKAHGMYGLLS